jgi:hypothetical protein
MILGHYCEITASVAQDHGVLPAAVRGTGLRLLGLALRYERSPV